MRHSLFFEEIASYFRHLKSTYRLFCAIRDFRPEDPRITGFKYAIYYGRFHFEPSRYTAYGEIDLAYREQCLDRIIREYTHPASRAEHLHLIRALQAGLERANTLGLIYGGNACDHTTGQPLRDMESDHYHQAAAALTTLVQAIAEHPLIWASVFWRKS